MNHFQEFTSRRLALGERFSRTLFVIGAGEPAHRSHSVNYRYKVASDFAYFVGSGAERAVLVIAGARSFLLLPEEDEEAQIWGDQISTGEMADGLGLDILRHGKLEELLRSLLPNLDRIALPLGRVKWVDELVVSLASFQRRHRERTSPITICDARPLVGTLRLVKSETEIRCLREAGQRSSSVHRELLQKPLVGLTEREVANWIEASFLQRDMQWTAYETIVGSGLRSTILHARASDKIIRAGEMLAVDAGGEWRGYCADITRSFPASERFSPAQAQVYGVVLAAQKAALAEVRPGATVAGIHETAQAVLREGLARLGVNETLQILMPHNTSHWLGLDVHDPSPYFDERGEAIRLQAGMTFTVEPGLYFREAGKYSGCGVRIEDDVLVTPTGVEIFSNVPKEIEEIEAGRSGAVTGGRLARPKQRTNAGSEE